MNPGDLYQYRGVLKARRIASQKQPLLIFIQDYPGFEDYGIFLTQNGKKIQLDKDLLEKVET